MVTYGPTKVENKSLQFRRSLYIVKDLKAGDIVTREAIRAIRPGLGLPAGEIDLLLGMTVQREVKRGTPVRWDLFK